jgi:hypothetical protein
VPQCGESCQVPVSRRWPLCPILRHYFYPSLKSNNKEQRDDCADWLEYGAQAMSNFAQFLAIFLTLTTAYLVSAFFAGKKLSRGQLVLINTFCILFASFNIFTQMVTLRNALFAFSRAFSSVEGMEGISQNLVGAFPIATSVICAGITLGCLNFMWDIRHPKGG